MYAIHPPLLDVIQKNDTTRYLCRDCMSKVQVT